MGSLMNQKKSTAFKKGALATAASVGGVVLSVAATPVLGLPVLGLGIYLGYDWFMFRARNGMRF